MTSPYAGGYTLPSGVTLTPEMLEGYSKFWERVQEAEGSRLDRQYAQSDKELGYRYATLAETREDRQQRLKVSMAQLEAERERNAISRGQMEADAQYKRDVIALQKQELGKSLLDTASSLFGKPGSWAQAINYARGVQGNQALAEPLRALLSGTSMPAFQAQTGTAAPLSIQGLADRLLGGGSAAGMLSGDSGAGGGYGDEYDTNVAAARVIGLNPQKLAPGSVESMTQMERDYLGDALRGSQIDPDNWLQQYYNSRPGQGLSDSGQA